MFSDLKQQLDGVLQTLQTTFADVQTNLARVETDIATIDAPLAGALDRAGAQAQEVQGLVISRLLQLRSTIQRLTT